jgi:hypothetical protein
MGITFLNFLLPTFPVVGVGDLTVFLVYSDGKYSGGNSEGKAP